ncbi:(-)-germacrene D synthase isoform X2 [Cucumis sativus]|uniref:(-)-germacrene D synthase isoform X2 n=2 Tax=Cucumis sativus TaxID=3659 RepID=UPI0012F4E663|nr:(-)-germacrene D synthase isoform X2 [Cucumis sativus]
MERKMSFEEVESNSMTSNSNSSFNDNGVPHRSEKFQSSSLGHYFLSHQPKTLEEDKMIRKKLQELKEEVRSMFVTTNKFSKKLSLIDSIQRLGLSYHFDDEINEVLMLMKNPCNVDDEHEDLYITALRFRLLRQQGFFVSCEIFNKFTNERGELKESIRKDENGLLSLYEASHLRMKGENILDEALAFTTTHLKAMAMDSNSPFFEEAKYALKWPIYKAVQRFMARHYISLYSNNPLKNNALLTFAKLDYNSLQKLYQKELSELSRWWKNQKFMEQLHFARDRVVECYLWVIEAYNKPNYCANRRIFLKMVNFLTIIDDMYDTYATLDELQLFTDAIQRWDIKSIEKLPNYMKGLYEAILEFFGEIEQDMSMDNNNIPFALDCAKEALKRQCKAYLVEAKWLSEGYVPTMEEYMNVGVVSVGTYVTALVPFLALGNVASKEVFQWVQTDPMLLKAGGIIARLMNDITSHKFGQEREHVVCAVECYMKQYGVTEGEAIVELNKEVVEAWKSMIQDHIHTKVCTKFPDVILHLGLNLARVTNFYYKERDAFTFVEGETKHLITSSLTMPI